MSVRDRAIIAVVAVAAALGAYWFLLLAPKREEAAALQTKIAQQQEALDSSVARLASALQARRNYATNYASVARLGQAVPAEDNVPSLVFQLDTAARASGVDFRAVKLTGSVEAASSSSSSAASQAATATLPPGAIVGPAGFPTMPFSFTFDGSFFAMAGFFDRLQRFVDAGGTTVRVGGRLLTLDGMALVASRKGFPRVKATVSATAYLVSGEEGATGGASPDSPGSAQTVSGSGSSSDSGSSSESDSPSALVPLLRPTSASLPPTLPAP